MNCEQFIQCVIDQPSGNQTPAEKAGGFSLNFLKKKTAPDGGSVNYARKLVARLFAKEPRAMNLTGDKGIIPRLSAEGLKKILEDGMQAQVFERAGEPGPKYAIVVEISKFESSQMLKEALAIFRDLRNLEIVEDAIDRIAAEIFKGVSTFSKDKDSRSIKANPEEILVVVSVRDDRFKEETGDKATWLLSFYSKLSRSESYEVFRLEERVKFWEIVTREQHLKALFDRQYKHLPTGDWKTAFTTAKERKIAEELLADFENQRIGEDQISDKMKNLLGEIAKSYGLIQKGALGLIASELPENHEIGIGANQNNKEKKSRSRGLIIRDPDKRLLGYIIYCTTDEKEAAELKGCLEESNRFHNVLLVYPENGKLELRLYHGKNFLEGRLRKGLMEFTGVSRIINLLSRYFVVSRAKVRNPEELAKELAYRARYLRQLALEHLETENPSDHLRELFNRFKEALIHDIDENRFADAYAQTLTYGLLTARWVSKDDTTGRFSREKALKSFPSTSPFLHEFFTTVFNATFEEKLTWLTDDIADLLDRIDMSAVFESAEGDEIKDPVIHFYEPFLGEYDAELRKEMGVYYTPKPVVSFIVRSVHEILQKDFGLEDGLASTITWGEYIKSHPEVKLPENADANSPFVQILDPATGTATFLVEVIDVIHKTMLAK